METPEVPSPIAKYEVPDLPGEYPGRSRVNPIQEIAREPLPEDAPMLGVKHPPNPTVGTPERIAIPDEFKKGPIELTPKIDTRPTPTPTPEDVASTKGAPTILGEEPAFTGPRTPQTQPSIPKEAVTVNPKTDTSPEIHDYVTDKYGPDMAQDIVRTVNIMKSSVTPSTGKKGDRDSKIPMKTPRKRLGIGALADIPMLEA
jgi:hypothetical protein